MSKNSVTVLLEQMPRLKRGMALGKMRQVSINTTSAEMPHLIAFESPQVSSVQNGYGRLFPVLLDLLKMHSALQEPIQKPNPLDEVASEKEVLVKSEGPLFLPVLLSLQYLLGAGENSPTLQLSKRLELSKDETRVDIAWRYQIPGTKGEPTVFAVVELKNTNVIHPKQFTTRHYGVERDREGRIRSKKWFQETGNDEKANLLMSANASKLTKQAMKYAIAQTPFVAMFDYDGMITMDFRGVDVQSQVDPEVKDPELVKLEILQETPEGLKEGKTFGTMLLGYLDHALQETLKRHNCTTSFERRYA